MWHKLASFSCPRKVLELPALTEFEVALFDNRVGEAAASDKSLSETGFPDLETGWSSANGHNNERIAQANALDLANKSPRVQP
jgi:hypothetical protein